LVQYYGWQREPDALKNSLERLVETARATGDIEGERYALSQLILTAPKSETTRRLQEINTAQGYAADTAAEAEGYYDAADFESFAPVGEETGEIAGEVDDYQAMVNEFSFAEVKSAYELESNGASNGAARRVENNHFATDETNSFDESGEAFASVKPAGNLKLSEKHKLEKEIEGIEFYVEQGYQDLAVKALKDLAAEYGEQPQITEWRARLADLTTPSDDEIVFEAEAATEKNTGKKKETTENLETLDELNNELDVEESVNDDIADQYETHYHLATAYRGMGLLEDAIREFQDAINLVEINDGTRRFFHCSNLLGHCFLEKQMPNLAVIWYRRSLEVASLIDEEKHALYYEIGNAFEAGGEINSSLEYFEKLYAEDVNYRDVCHRLKSLRA
ncbi:MAG: hypothetical protein M3T96_03735, partial [Acidobacteriota bacterium]|nr:hypothetical protein [Acidobacteriota bacterium]